MPSSTSYSMQRSPISSLYTYALCSITNASHNHSSSVPFQGTCKRAFDGLMMHIAQICTYLTYVFPPLNPHSKQISRMNHLR